MKPFKTVIAPKGCYSYLTAGKEYEVLKIYNDDEDNPLLTLKDDNGIDIEVRLKVFTKNTTNYETTQRQNRI